MLTGTVMFLTRDDLCSRKIEKPKTVDFKCEIQKQMSIHHVVLFDNGNEIIVLKNRYGPVGKFHHYNKG